MADDVKKLREGEISVDASQLRPGVYVRLPISWLEHQFAFNAFVIGSDDQVRQIAALNLPEIICDPARCKVPPLPKQEALLALPPVTDAESIRLAELTAKQMADKMERAKTIAALQKRLDVTQKHYIDASRSVGSAFKSFEMSPQESLQQIAKVSEQSTKILLSDVDSALVLIAEKGQSDGATAHALSVMTLSLLLGKQALLPEDALRTLAAGALLHDIGKATINTSILRNQERNKHEEAVYMTHCRLGFESALKTNSLSRPVLESILHHHERFDGSGYPDRLSGEAIHVAARIVCIANRFDNLANPMDYRRAMSPSEALSHMWVKEKAAYDPKMLQLFIRAMGVYPPGSIVKLSDGRVAAVVVSANSEKPLCPQVMVYDAEIPRKHAIIIDLAKDTSVKVDHALRLRDRPDDELDYLLPRRKMSWFCGEK